mmetsp:Transcript_1444/g.4238  ORF Transcript_1444/g.4238 Transcript_1444/m.4238 type:complete len:309 (-) Transcript_1444:621-1547(-)
MDTRDGPVRRSEAADRGDVAEQLLAEFHDQCANLEFAGPLGTHKHGQQLLAQGFHQLSTGLCTSEAHRMQGEDEAALAGEEGRGDGGAPPVEGRRARARQEMSGTHVQGDSHVEPSGEDAKATCQALRLVEAVVEYCQSRSGRLELGAQRGEHRRREVQDRHGQESGPMQHLPLGSVAFALRGSCGSRRWQDEDHRGVGWQSREHGHEEGDRRREDLLLAEPAERERDGDAGQHAHEQEPYDSKVIEPPGRGPQLTQDQEAEGEPKQSPNHIRPSTGQGSDAREAGGCDAHEFRFRSSIRTAADHRQC